MRREKRCESVESDLGGESGRGGRGIVDGWTGHATKTITIP